MSENTTESLFVLQGKINALTTIDGDVGNAARNLQTDINEIIKTHKNYLDRYSSQVDSKWMNTLEKLGEDKTTLEFSNGKDYYVVIVHKVNGKK